MSEEKKPEVPMVAFILPISMAEVEKELILRTIAHFEGDKRRASSVLGISLKTVYNKLASYR